MGRRKKTEDNGVATAEPENVVETNESPPEEAEQGNRPCKRFSIAAGNGVYVQASIWPRQITVKDKEITVYSATVRKSYKKEDGSYGNTNFFRGSELDLVVFVLDKASDWISEQRVIADPPF